MLPNYKSLSELNVVNNSLILLFRHTIMNRELGQKLIDRLCNSAISNFLKIIIKNPVSLSVC